MSKYSKLTDYLQSQNAKEIKLSFSEIEKIIQDVLPPSAYKYPAWWANDNVSKKRQCESWMSIGWESAEVQLGESITFIKK